MVRSSMRRGESARPPGPLLSHTWHVFYGAIWHHPPIKGSFVGDLVDSPPVWCQRSLPDDGAARAAFRSRVHPGSHRAGMDRSDLLSSIGTGGLHAHGDP